MGLREIIIAAGVGALIGYNLHPSPRSNLERDEVSYELNVKELNIHQRTDSGYSCMTGMMNTATKIIFSFEDGELFWLETDFGLTDNNGRRYNSGEVVGLLSPLFGKNNNPSIEITAIPLAEESGKRIYDILEFSLGGRTYIRFKKDSD